MRRVDGRMAMLGTKRGFGGRGCRCQTGLLALVEQGLRDRYRGRLLALMGRLSELLATLPLVAQYPTPLILHFPLAFELEKKAVEL
jgi:hypothetical protein